jgi:hypothetical protein
MNIGKRILFITPAFFGYEESIKNALIENGFVVDYFDERVSNNSFFKAVFRVKKDLLGAVITNYYKNILKLIEHIKYDYFFLIKGEVVPEFFILEFKQKNPSAKLIYYTYDSFNNNNKHSQFILKHFDKCFSFDFEDVANNPQLTLKHLFYSEEFVLPQNSIRKFTMSFVGTLHSNRYVEIKQLFSKLTNTYAFFYSQAKWFFLYQKAASKVYRAIKWDEVSFKKLSKTDVAKIFASSRGVVDIQRYGQTGLTMRTFEVLASGAILVTTNNYIKKADFYDPDYIIVVDEINSSELINEIQQKLDRFESLKILVDTDFKKYSVNEWVKDFFQF